MIHTDYAINSAGLVVGGRTVTSIAETDEEAYDKIQAVDARGVFFCMKHELQVMIKQSPLSSSARSSRGVIINMASRASLEGVPEFGAVWSLLLKRLLVVADPFFSFKYCSAKHAVLVRCSSSLLLPPSLISTPSPGHDSGRRCWLVAGSDDANTRDLTTLPSPEHAKDRIRVIAVCPGEPFHRRARVAPLTIVPSPLQVSSVLLDTSKLPRRLMICY